jgi:peptidyl-prolyl cis-trans isomerase SurA
VHGGRIGWIKPGEILPEVEARAFALAEGAIDGPIPTAQGWFLVNVLDRKEPEGVPFEGAKSAVLKRLLKDRQREAYAVWATRLRERAEIVFDEAGIHAAVEWLARQPQEAPRPSDTDSPHAREDGGR